MLRNDMDTISFSRREKWLGQIKQAIERLYSEVVIWGRCESGECYGLWRDDALLVDIGGGLNSNGELMDRMEGNLEELHELCRFLKV